MAVFGFLYLVLIVYVIFLRISARSNTKYNEPVGMLYKIQAWTAVVISGAAATTTNILLAESALDWILQYIPTIIISLIVVVWPKMRRSTVT